MHSTPSRQVSGQSKPNMEVGHHHHHHRHQPGIRSIYHDPHQNQPQQLPSFQHFVQEVGQADLAHRPPVNTETIPIDSSYRFGGSALPTPPATAPSHSSGFFKQEAQHYQHVRTVEENDSGQAEAHRRSSFALPPTTRPQPRQSRAYSNNNVSNPPQDVMSWQHGRVIQEETIPGRGECYVYDDGYVCPKEINGDTVNPKWGTTKAGKPRKRLGQACNTCREKKIKCDPGIPKCSQCQRFNRECRFDTK